MRIAAMVCALAIGMGFGAFLWRGASIPSSLTSLTQTGPAVEFARTVVRPAEERRVPSANPAKLASASDVPPSVSTLLAQGSPAVAAAPVAAPAPARAQVAAIHPATVTSSCPGNPNALGVSRVVEIDTTGGPGFGFEHFKAYDFLKINEVVLTFDDGPWPNNTPAVLAALAAHCTKALFFPIGKHALWHPEILKQVAEAGHTIGSHTWSHADLSKKNVVGKDEIEKGISAVQAALGESRLSPFF